MVAPLIVKVVAFSLAKKVIVFLVAKLYGFPRLYRRASELNHYVNRDNATRREKFQNRLHFLFRLPTHIYKTVQRWRGVQPPQGPPSAPGQSQRINSRHPQHHQGHEFHTSSHSLRVPLLNVSNPSNFGGFGSISQSIRSHLLGLRAGGSQNSKIRPFSGFATLPLGVTSLVSPSRETKSLQTMSRGHFSAVDLVNSHIIQMKASN